MGAQRVIPLSKERFASCSEDWTVRIWRDDNTYECIFILEHDDRVRTILQLIGKEVSISCGSNSLPGVSFWNINDYTHQLSIEGYGVIKPTYMTELSNGNIALLCLLSTLSNCYY